MLNQLDNTHSIFGRWSITSVWNFVSEFGISGLMTAFDLLVGVPGERLNLELFFPEVFRSNS